MNSSQPGAPTARAVRFSPDPLDHALVAFDGFTGEFRPDLIGLIYDEAPMNGCGLVLQDHPRLVAEALCLVKVGRMDPVAAQVVWKKEIQPRLVHVGFHYLE
jgi:hypothetical protein